MSTTPVTRCRNRDPRYRHKGSGQQCCGLKDLIGEGGVRRFPDFPVICNNIRGLTSPARLKSTQRRLSDSVLAAFAEECAAGQIQAAGGKSFVS